MAGDWIKMRHNLVSDPDVIRIADLVGVDRHSVVGRLHALWSWADSHSVDGHSLSVTTLFLDELVACDGFCKALRSVGWLDGRDWELSFPNFGEHNGETAKKRAKDAKRKQKSRNSPDSVHEMSHPKCDKSVTREEKRRKEKKREETKKTKTKKEELFDLFWSEYPRRVGKQAARKAFDKAIQKADEKLIIQKASAYGKSLIVAEGYSKNPATWLNQACWEDDEAAWNTQKSTQKTFSQQRLENTMEASRQFLDRRRAEEQQANVIDVQKVERSGGLIGMSGGNV